jgi:cardiolipin synthase
MGGQAKDPRSLHAKMLLADDNSAIDGSINISPGSFDHRRELSIEVSDPYLVKRLEHTFNKGRDNSELIHASTDKAIPSHRLFPPGIAAE